MAEAVAAALTRGEHLMVQAGTGTGKSLGYLAPALAHLSEHPEERVVIATATLALQAQLATADIPLALDAAEQVTGRRARWALLKGRSNYACLHRVTGGVGQEQETLVAGETVADQLRAAHADRSSVIGAEVVALREWAQAQLDDDGSGDRDAAPTHTPLAWAQVSVPARECLGAASCPFGDVCFVERSKETARNSQLIVTNHALLAINAANDGSILPAHERLIIDEAHELAARVTGAASRELSPQQLERLARRCLPHLNDDLALEFLDLADTLTSALEDAPLERIQDAGSAVVAALERVRSVTREVAGSLAGSDDPERRQAQAAVKEIHEIAGAMAVLEPSEVLWVSERERSGRWLVMAPLQVAGLLRGKILTTTPTVFTSATLALGGGFGPAAASVGLRAAERLPDEVAAPATNPSAAPRDDTAADAADQHDDAADQRGDGGDQGGDAADPGGEGRALPWRGLDVGSPFDYPRQGILYIADRLPPPHRDGIGPQALAEVAELLWAAGGRTLGLFASQRNAEAAARHCRAELPDLTVLCQGDAQLSELTRRFVAEPDTSLFGTLSLWQGVDVPGDACQLVIIDKIPFPRPDEPLMRARQQAVAEAGGNGFMAVAASHAALLLAQGAGRLIRRATDRGVVAVLDPRLRKARYGSYLRASMPKFWQTTDREVAVSALRRLAAARFTDDAERP